MKTACSKELLHHFCGEDILKKYLEMHRVGKEIVVSLATGTKVPFCGCARCASCCNVFMPQPKIKYGLTIKDMEELHCAFQSELSEAAFADAIETMHMYIFYITMPLLIL